jgi:hypothetical protein
MATDRLLPALLPGALRSAWADYDQMERLLARTLLAHVDELQPSDRVFLIREVNWALAAGRARAVDEWRQLLTAVGGRCPSP